MKPKITRLSCCRDYHHRMHLRKHACAPEKVTQHAVCPWGPTRWEPNNRRPKSFARMPSERCRAKSMPAARKNSTEVSPHANSGRRACCRQCKTRRSDRAFFRDRSRRIQRRRALVRGKRRAPQGRWPPAAPLTAAALNQEGAERPRQRRLQRRVPPRRKAAAGGPRRCPPPRRKAGRPDREHTVTDDRQRTRHCRASLPMPPPSVWHAKPWRANAPSLAGLARRCAPATLARLASVWGLALPGARRWNSESLPPMPFGIHSTKLPGATPCALSAACPS